MPEPNGGTDQDVVPEPSNQVEETADLTAEDGPSAGPISTGLFPRDAVPTTAILRCDGATRLRVVCSTSRRRGQSGPTAEAH